MASGEHLSNTDVQTHEPGGEVLPTTYDFHNLFSVSVAHRRLNRLMKRELQVFRRETDRLDLRVEEGFVPLPDKLLFYPWDEVNYSFDDSSCVLETPSGRIQVAENLLRAEPRTSSELLLDQLVVNVMRSRIIAKGASLVHASAVSREGVGLLFPAWAHSGKTNVALSFLADGYDFMSDDWSFVTSSGEILGYPRWLKIFDYNLRCHPFLMETLNNRKSRRSLKRRLAATEFANTLDRSHGFSRRLRHLISSRYGAYFKVPHTAVMPGCEVVIRSPLSKVCLLTAVRSDTCKIRDISPERLAAKVVSCAHFEQGAFRRHSSAIAYAGQWDVQEDLVSEEIDLLTMAFRQAKCIEVMLPSIHTSKGLDQLRQLVEGA